LTLWTSIVGNGVAFGLLLFLLSSGLSLIFGVMRVVNLAHGSFYLVGAYVGLEVFRVTGSLAAAAAGAAAIAIALGLLLQRAFLRRLGGDVLPQVLLTMGFLLLLGDLSLWIWGGNPQIPAAPAGLGGSVAVAGAYFPRYRIFVSLVALLAAGGLWWFLERTPFGSAVRAAVDDPEMAQGLGVNVPLVSTSMFALGAALAGVGGVLGSPILGVYPGVDLDILALTLAVVIIGGIGSLPGTLVGSLFVGVADNLGKALFPELSYVTFFAPMALVLALRPRGLFGRG
jgi:branched-chain amino acid transport system permease protein